MSDNNKTKITYGNTVLQKLDLPLNQRNDTLRNMSARLGGLEDHPVYLVNNTLDETTNMSNRLHQKGGFPQQNRMIRDKRHSLDMATKYSYQGARLKRWYSKYVDVMDGELDEPPIPALINPNKLKQDYDDKILSVQYDFKFAPGDIFEWCNTHTYWIIYLQDLDELAYFRGDIRRCRYIISWEDDNGEKHQTYAAVRGPVETKIDYIQKHLISIDNPNYSLNILMPQTKDTVSYFKRYSKFYLRDLVDGDTDICWRVEATDSISMQGILEINATEYYSNVFKDDLDEGIANGLIEDPVDPNPEVSETETSVIGESFIKPKKEYTYYINSIVPGTWKVNDKLAPIKLTPDGTKISIEWDSPYSGSFILRYQTDTEKYDKIITVESLF